MSEQTIASAFALCPTSTENTNLQTAFGTVLTDIDAAATAGAFSTIIAGQLKDMVIDVAEEVAGNMSDWAG